MVAALEYSPRIYFHEIETSTDNLVNEAATQMSTSAITCQHFIFAGKDRITVFALQHLWYRLSKYFRIVTL
jgi:hypothetical protein